jgi:stage II sporulation protein D
MLLVKVAILGLLHLQQVTINGIEFTIANLHNQTRTIPGPIRVQANKTFQRTYHGTLQITAKNNELELILTASEDDLVAATVAAESPANASPAALEAQAILARSWIRASKNRHRHYDLCDTTHCQHLKQPTPASRAATKRTSGLLLTWRDEPFAPAYSAACGGQTKTAAAIGWNDDNRYPYFEVDCPICRRDEPPWTRPALPEILQNPNKEATRIAIGRRLGWSALPSNNYEIIGAELHGRGHGHGLGYCQKGGAGLARQGLSPADILRHYFPGTNIMSSR